MKELTKTIRAHNKLVTLASKQYADALQALVNKHNVFLATGQLSNVWQVRLPSSDEWHSSHEWERKIWDHPIFKEIEALDESVEDLGIGPSNMEMYKPQKR